jgi:hypothetical protein
MGKLKGLLLVLLVFACVYTGWKLIPPLVNEYRLQDELDDIARRATYSAKSDEDIRNTVIQKAATFDIPLREDQVSISRTADGCGITVHYRLHFDLIVYQYDKDFVVNSLTKRI